MSRNDARPTGEETISQAQQEPERNSESNQEPAQGGSSGADLDTGDNWVQREDQERSDSER